MIIHAQKRPVQCMYIIKLDDDYTRTKKDLSKCMYIIKLNDYTSIKKTCPMHVYNKIR